MRQWLHRLPDLLDHAIRAHEECRALHTHVLLAVHALFHPHTHRPDQQVVRICDQGKVEAMLTCEALMAEGIIGTDSENSHTDVLERRQVVAERACFDSAARCVVLWIEVKEIPLPRQLSRADTAPIVDRQLELWNAIAGLQHGSPRGKKDSIWSKAGRCLSSSRSCSLKQTGCCRRTRCDPQVLAQPGHWPCVELRARASTASSPDAKAARPVRCRTCRLRGRVAGSHANAGGRPHAPRDRRVRFP